MTESQLSEKLNYFLYFYYYSVVTKWVLGLTFGREKFEILRFLAVRVPFTCVRAHSCTLRPGCEPARVCRRELVYLYVVYARVVYW